MVGGSGLLSSRPCVPLLCLHIVRCSFLYDSGLDWFKIGIREDLCTSSFPIKETTVNLRGNFSRPVD